MNWFKMFLAMLVLTAVGFTAVLATDFNDKSVAQVSANSCLNGPTNNGEDFMELCLLIPDIDHESCIAQCTHYCDGLYGPEGLCIFDEGMQSWCYFGCYSG